MEKIFYLPLTTKVSIKWKGETCFGEIINIDKETSDLCYFVEFEFQDKGKFSAWFRESELNIFYKDLPKV